MEKFPKFTFTTGQITSDDIVIDYKSPDNKIYLEGSRNHLQFDSFDCLEKLISPTNIISTFYKKSFKK